MLSAVVVVVCVVGLAHGQAMTGEDQTPDRLQLYQILDEKVDQITQMAQDLGAAIDALRAGKARDFLKGSVNVPGAPQTQADGPVDAARFQGPIGSSFGSMQSFPLMPAPIPASSESGARQVTEGGSGRSKRSYGYGRRYGGYGGYGSRYGGYGGYSSSRYGGYGGSRYGGYGGYGGSRYYG